MFSASSFGTKSNMQPWERNESGTETLCAISEEIQPSIIALNIAVLQWPSFQVATAPPNLGVQLTVVPVV